jgi:hypothetical protein
MEDLSQCAIGFPVLGPPVPLIIERGTVSDRLCHRLFSSIRISVPVLMRACSLKSRFLRGLASRSISQGI